MRMRIERRVPARQRQTLEYMRGIEPVWKTVEDLIKAVLLTRSGADPEDFPDSVRHNKAFDGGHHERHMMEEFLADCKHLHLRVFRGNISEDTLEKQLEKSPDFRVAFVKNSDEVGLYGYEFVVSRDGTLFYGMSSATLTI